MGILKLAVATERWDLAAHTIVLAAANIITGGEKHDSRESKKKRRPKGQPKR